MSLSRFFPRTPAGSTELKQRFDREAKTIAGLKHPHICVLHDIGSEAGTDNASQPFWSPDSASIGFVSGGRLKKVAAAGTPQETQSGTLDAAWEKTMATIDLGLAAGTK